jgi:hypothetical protein
MAHASAPVLLHATRARHHADAAGSWGGGLTGGGHRLSRPDGRLAPPPLLWAHRAVPLLRTHSTPPGVNGASRRVLGGISRRRTTACAQSAPAAPSSKDAKQGRILLGVVGASYGAALRVQSPEQARAAVLSWLFALRFSPLSEPTDTAGQPPPDAPFHLCPGSLAAALRFVFLLPGPPVCPFA